MSRILAENAWIAIEICLLTHEANNADLYWYTSHMIDQPKFGKREDPVLQRLESEIRELEKEKAQISHYQGTQQKDPKRDSDRAQKLDTLIAGKQQEIARLRRGQLQK